jgi:hypothetical protein
MYLETSFTRVVTAQGTWTADVLPTEPLVQPSQIAQGFRVNSLPANALILFPPPRPEPYPQRMVVAYSGPTGAGTVSASLYCYETNTNAWFQLDNTQTLTPSTPAAPGAVLGYFNMILPRGSASAAVQYVLIVSTPSSPVVGTYTFAFGPDMAGADDADVLSDLAATEQQILALLAGGLPLGQASGATNRKVSATTTATQMLAFNARRIGAIISNDVTSTGSLYLLFVPNLSFGTPSSSNYSVYPVTPGSSYTLDMSMVPYVGAIFGVFGTTSGFAMVTELTP